MPAVSRITEIRTEGLYRVVNAIRKLARNPRPRGCRKLRDYSDVYRIRVGVFRILYSIEQVRLLVLVLKIGHRRDVYR